MSSERTTPAFLPRALLVAAGALVLAAALAALPPALTVGQEDAAPARAVGQEDAAPAPGDDATSPGRQWATAADLLDIVPDSHRLLLGERKPNGRSCGGKRPLFGLYSHPAGGPATRMAYLWVSSAPERTSPLKDFQWYQTTLRTAAARMKDENRRLYPKALRLAEETARLARALADATAWPADLRPVDVPEGSDRLRRWVGHLNQAVTARRLPEARRASAELASAALALADLHRWLDLIASNFLDQLAFQASCRHVYAAYNDAFPGGYRADMHLCGFPGGRAWIAYAHNLVPVEHEAEWLFWPPADAEAADDAEDAEADDAEDADAEDADADAGDAVAAAVWMPPALRPTFLRLREGLGPDARRAWDHAARAPFHHSYLANTLFHVAANDGAAPVAQVLARYEAAAEEISAEGMMDVLFHRAGDPDGGEVWDDRFHPHLMAAAATMAGTNRQVLLGAQHFVRALFGGWEHYGKAITLRVALEENHFDCIGATDMIGALYRNAGRTGFYNIHLAAGGGSHTLAAASVRDGQDLRIIAADGLDTAHLSGFAWPEAFFHDGTGWPAGYTGTPHTIRTAELYGRGLGSYLWLEGYVLRGIHAGHFAVSSVPYLPDRARVEPARLRRALSERASAPRRGP